jgi:PAS domain S-box-containing protein
MGAESKPQDNPVEEDILIRKGFYKNIIGAIKTGVWVADKDDRICYANEGMGVIAGIRPDDIKDSNVLKDFPEETLRYFKPQYEKAKETLTPVYYDALKVITPAGRITYQSGWLIPRIKDKQFDGMICTVEDVTDRKQAKDKLKESETRYRTLFETAGAAIFTVRLTKEGPQVADCNTSALKMFGYNKEEIVGLNPAEFSPPTQPDGSSSEEGVMKTAKAAMEGKPQIIEWIHRRKDGSLFNAEVTVNVVDIGKKSFMQAIVREKGSEE